MSKRGSDWTEEEIGIVPSISTIREATTQVPQFATRARNGVRDRHMFRELIVIGTCVMFTMAHDCTRVRISKFNNWIEFAPFWEMNKFV
jgi:hypothetical protein